jgi:hypothetical protein
MVGEITENNMADELNLAQQGTLPPDIYAQQQALNRQQQMAAMLMQQNQQPQGQMVSGRYVPTSFFQNLQPVANMLTGAYLAKQGDAEAAKLAKQIREGKSAAEESILKSVTGYDKATELAGPYAGNVPMPVAVEKVAPNYAEALRKINDPYSYGAGADLKPLIYKQMMPEPTPEERKYKAALADDSFKGGFNAFLNQMSEKDRADIRIQNARLGLAQQEQAWNMGLPMAGGGGAGVPQGAPQAPLQTINPGSPILAPGQQVAPQQGAMPQQGLMPGQPPRFNSKAEQDAWLAGQKKTAELKAEAQNALPGALLTAQTGIDTIRELIGDTKVDAKGNIVYGKQLPKAGFEASVGMPSAGSLFGITNLFPGSEASNFKAAFEQVGGQAFLGAISTLKGSGAISEVEGSKATSALNRMKLSQSEVEFIKAANDFKDVLEKGYKAAQQRAGAIPMNPTAQPSLGGGSTPKYVYDPVTGTLK